MENDCYCPLLAKATHIPDFVNTLLATHVTWTEHFGFDAIELPDTFIEIEPALKETNKKHKIQRLGLLRIPENTMYDWHVDQYRLSCINMLINTDHHSHTLFGAQKDYINKKIIELKYEPNTFYLFNNQMEHCVINLDGPRYLFSLYFEEEIDFAFLKDKLQDLIKV
jgi:hypothetical protein